MKHHLPFNKLLPLAILVSLLACRVDNAGLGVAEMAVVPHDSGTFVDVPTGAAGSKGTAGDTATAGTSGAAGDLGAAGLAGPGTAGDTGSAGAGTAGDQGAAGATGTAGAQGAAGVTGSAGDLGAAGTTGTAGDSGAAGVGAAGTMGAAGTTGAAGSGAAGSGAAGSGAAGSGAAGTTGAAGSGAAGSGAAGAQGCGPKTCPNGCCDTAGKCVGGKALDKCGHGGGACAACGNCQLCNDSGICDVNPSSTWDIVCAQAVIAQTQPMSTLTWDPRTSGPDGTQPDPFCQFEMPANSLTGAKVSPTLADTFTPVWNYDITPNGKPIKAADLMSSSTTWRLWIGDDDGCGVRGCVGQELCEIDQPVTAGSLLAGQAVYQNLSSCLSLTVKFVCKQ